MFLTKPVSTICATALIVCSALLLTTNRAHANPFTTDNVTVSLVAEHTTLQPGVPTTLLLHIAIRDGWHTYWRNPGDSGEATTIDWSLPAGLGAGAIVWPAPHAIPFSGFVNFGYEGDAWHLVPLTVEPDLAVDRDVTLVAQARWLVCEEICIPEEGELRLTLPVRASTMQVDDTVAARFAAARSGLPQAEQLVDVTLGENDVALSVGAFGPLDDPFFFPADWGVVEASAPQRVVERDGQTVLLLAPGAAPPSAAFAGVLVDRGSTGQRAWALRTRTATQPAVVPPVNQMSVPLALVFAFIGGVILNLMPCVFPVLSMKALHFAGGQVDARARRREGLAYTLGVLVFFLILGGALLALRHSGQAIGWGFQLQSPVVVGVLALLMFLIGLNLLGAFEVGGRLMGVGSKLAQKSGTAGAFFTGALAAVVATPCTAPFMGAALGFALTQSAPVALLVMLFLGLGLASPFTLLALSPGLASRLPRPGAWMETFRQLLAFPMFAAAVWLAWVLVVQAGADGALRLLVAALLASFTIWLIRRGAKRGVALAIAVVSGAGALATLGSLTALGEPSTAHVAEAQNFSAARVAQAREAGKTVFVNQTAAWCLTCLVNEKNVLAKANVQQAFADDNVVYLAGDWTRRDPAITAFLREHGRSGVPLYVVYHGDGPANVLPPLLTEAIVLDALSTPGP